MYMYMYILICLSFPFFKLRSLFHTKEKCLISDQGVFWNESGSEAEHFILNQSDLAFSECLFLLFTSEAAKTDNWEKYFSIDKASYLFHEKCIQLIDTV